MSAAAHTTESGRPPAPGRAAAEAVQTRLNVGPSNDGYEQEADRTAASVVGRSGGAAAPLAVGAAPAAPSISRLVRRKVESSEDDTQTKIQRQEEEEEAQTSIQRQEEEEAQTSVQRQDEDKKQAGPEEEGVQRKEAKPTVRDKRIYPELGRVEKKLFESKGKGEPMADELRIEMERGFGADFGGVRIHTDDDAVRMNRDLRAQAFTHGRDLYFNAGKYKPDSLRGKTLLAHELTHVVQQGAAERKVSDQTVAENNARKDQPPPSPADSGAKRVEEQADNAQEKGTLVPLPETTAESGTSGGGSAAPAAEGDVSADEKSTPEEKSMEAGGEKDAEKQKEGEGAKKDVGQKGKGRRKSQTKRAKGKGIGAYLRQTTAKKFEQKQGSVAALAENQKKKEEAATKLKQTEKAVVPPEQEAEARARATQVTVVADAPKPEPDEAAAKERFDTVLQRAVPSTLEEVDRFKEEGKGRLVGENVRSVVTADAARVENTYQEIENPPTPEPSAQVPEELPELEQAPETPPLDLAEGVVGQVQPEHTDLSSFDSESDELLEREGISEEQLEMVDEGDLAEAREDRAKVKETVREGPAEVKALERQEKEKVDQDLKKEESDARTTMQVDRDRELTGAREKQTATKSAIELKRQKVTEHINGIYEKANTTVREKLDELEKKSLADFDRGQADATRDFENNVNRRIDAFKRRRYDRFGGSLLWAKDKLFGIDDMPEVAEIFESEKSHFTTTIDGLIRRITEESRRVVQECRDIVAAARAEISTYVEGLGPELQKTGEEALSAMKGKLDALDQQIADREKELQKKLAEKREAAIKAIEEKIEKMKEDMSGLVSKLGSLLLQAAIKFFKWALKKAGLDSGGLMGIIDKGKSVLEKIVGDPIGFIKNLVKGVKTGIETFVTNIRKHLVSGLISWLTGSMADVPITLPDKWDLKGILHLILQILGLTWERIRVKLVKRLGERAVSIAETTVDIVHRLINEGPMALWEMIREKAEDIRTQVMEGIRNWVVVQLVKQGVIKLVSFLNPAGAILQAIIAIYNTIMFFVENAQRIAEFFRTVVGTVGDIAMGRISAAAAAVENALAMTIPIILNFLARLIGLSGIGKTVTEIIRKVRKPIDRIVDRVVDRIVGMAKKLVGKAKKGAEALKEKGLAIIKWWKKRKAFRSADGETHSVFVKKTGNSYALMMASNEQPVEQAVIGVAKDADPDTKTAANAARAGIDQVEVLIADLKKLGNDPEKNKAQISIKNAELDKALQVLAIKLSNISFREGEGLPDRPVQHYDKGEKASSVRAQELSANRDEGSIPGEDPVGWDLLKLGLTTGGANWRRMHLINENFGGPGEKKNLVPGTQQNNSAHLHGFEKHIKTLIGEKPKDKNKKGVVWMTAKVSYYGAGDKPPEYDTPLSNGKKPDITHYAKEMKFQAGRQERQGEKKWSHPSKVNVADLTVNVPKPDWTEVVDGGAPKLGSASPGALRAAVGATGLYNHDRINDSYTDYVVRSIIQKHSYGSVSDIRVNIDAEIENERHNDATVEKLNYIRLTLVTAVNKEKVKL